jgi:flagellar basal body-associated protein FliL
MEKKQISLIVLVVILIVSLIGTLAFIFGGGVKSEPKSPFTKQENKVIGEMMNNTTTPKWNDLRASLINSVRTNFVIEIANLSQQQGNNGVAQIPFDFQGKKWQLNCGLIDLNQPALQPQATTTTK